MPLLRTPAAALLLGYSVATLRSWVRRGHGPAYERIAGVVVYRQDELERWQREDEPAWLALPNNRKRKD